MSTEVVAAAALPGSTARAPFSLHARALNLWRMMPERRQDLRERRFRA